MQELKGKSGVYLFFNHVNGHCYIGSSVDLSHRFYCHLFGFHSNVVLQNAFNKYSIGSFSFIILCLCSKSLLLTHEQKALDLLSPVYNIAKKVSAPFFGLCHTPWNISSMQLLLQALKQPFQQRILVLITGFTGNAILLK